MKKYIAAYALALVLPLSGPALAQDPPNWPLSAACSSGDDWCPRFEQRARGQITGVWNTLPPEIRAACISETEAIEKSYRLLSNCLANRMQEHIKGQARQTS